MSSGASQMSWPETPVWRHRVGGFTYRDIINSGRVLYCLMSNVFVILQTWGYAPFVSEWIIGCVCVCVCHSASLFYLFFNSASLHILPIYWYLWESNKLWSLNSSAQWHIIHMTCTIAEWCSRRNISWYATQPIYCINVSLPFDTNDARILLIHKIKTVPLFMVTCIGHTYFLIYDIIVIFDLFLSFFLSID